MTSRLTEDDKKAWAGYARGVKRIRETDSPRVISKPSSLIPKSPSLIPKPSSVIPAQAGIQSLNEKPVRALLEHNLDPHTLRRIKQKKLPIDARLDLHGLTQAQAHHALIARLPLARKQGVRCVLVITGKGIGKPEGSVLQHNVPRWLETTPLAAHVQGFHLARPEDGGSGALYVVLRKKSLD